MGQNFTRLMLSVGVLGLLASCSSDKEQPQAPDQPVNGVTSPLTFTSQLRGMTRATETAFEAGDSISLFAVSGAAGSSSVVLAAAGNQIHNQKFVYDGTQFVSNPPVYKPESDLYAYFAVYPYAENVGPNFDFSVRTDQSPREAYTASDLSTSTTGYISDAHPDLTFYHRLSNLEVTLEGSNLAGDLKVEILNAPTTVNVDLNNLSVSTKGASATIIPNEYGTNVWRAIVAPCSYAAGSPVVRATLNGRTYDLAHSSPLELASGKQVNLKLKIIDEVPVIVSGDIYPWNTGSEINYVIPAEILGKLDDHITINYGVNPPDVEGCYMIDPFEAVYCEDEGNGGYDPGTLVTGHYILFSDQNRILRTLNFSELSFNYNNYSIGNGAFISGSNNKFSVFFSTEGESAGIYVKEALVISGEKTSEGIANLEYAFVMVDKGDDPNNILMDKGVYRVFKDQDGLSVNGEWPSDVFPLHAPRILNKFNPELFLRK